MLRKLTLTTLSHKNKKRKGQNMKIFATVPKQWQPVAKS